jgi:RHS repeat-associated protein
LYPSSPLAAPARAPASTTEYYYYDAVGNLTSKTDRKSQTITYTYDQLNRLTQKAYPDSTAVNYTSNYPSKILFEEFDSRLTQVTDPTGTYSFAAACPERSRRNNMGRLTQAVSQYSFLAGRNFTTSYTYDAASNRTGFTDPESGSTTYAYDTLNRLQTLTPPTAFTNGNFGFTYDQLSRRTQMTRPNGISTNYSYDNLSRLLSVLHQSGNTTLDGAIYTVDNAGNRTSKADQLAGVTSNYTYDPIYELSQVTQGTNTTESYTFDPVGNRLSSLNLSPYSYNVSNELTSTPSTTYTFDNNGNTLTKVVGSNTTTYAWDFENRLTSVTLPGSGGTVSFKYDPFGRRVYKSSSSGTSIYAYDGDGLAEETNSSGTAVARYSLGLNIDEPLAMLRSSTTSYYDADGQGSVTSLSSSPGSLAQTYGYDSFGKQTSSSGSLTNPFQFTAREFDAETSLYYYRSRYFDSSVGRFMNEDSIGFRGGANFYAYVGNNPILWIDPFGMAALSYDQIAKLVAANNKSLRSDELIICVIYKESSFDPAGANPNSSAVGLMGVEKGAASDLNIPYNTLSDPATNIAAGSQYLHRRIDWKPPFGAGGDVRTGLANYGTGEPYADSILKCEKCLKEEAQKASDCKTKDCLEPLHPKK